MPAFGFVGGSYAARSLNADAEKCINLFPEVVEVPNGKSKVTLYGTPGLSTLPLATLAGQTSVRALFAGDPYMYAVGSDSLFRIATDGTTTLRGALNSAATPASIHANGSQLMVVSGDTIFIDDGVSVASTLTDGYVSGAFLDGYFIALRNPTATNGLLRDRIYISALFNGLTWDPLDYQERQGAADRLVAIRAHNQQLWLFGQQTSEAWYNSGAADFPFERIQGSQMGIGALPWTIANADTTLLAVTTSNQGANVVCRFDGFRPTRVSTHAIESALSTVQSNSNPRAYTYQEEGHWFYVLCIGSSKTWVYDLTAGLWHERAHWNGTAFEAHIGQCHTHHYLHLNVIGSRNTGEIYNQGLNYYGAQGLPIRRYRQAPHLSAENQETFYHRFTLDMEMGGVTSGTPTALLKWSDDGGKTFGADKSVNLGAAGQFKKRAIWRRLGRSRDRVFAVTLPDISTARVAIVEAYLDSTPGNGA